MSYEKELGREQQLGRMIPELLLLSDVARHFGYNWTTQTKMCFIEYHLHKESKYIYKYTYIYTQYIIIIIIIIIYIIYTSRFYNYTLPPVLKRGNGKSTMQFNDCMKNDHGSSQAHS